jgi:hypothetical protein
MRRTAFVFLALLAVSLLGGIREADAAPTNEVWDSYFDCALNEVGWTVLTCSGQRHRYGTLAGAYRLREWYGCYSYDSGSQWFYWNGSGWTPFSGPPGPNC